MELHRVEPFFWQRSSNLAPLSGRIFWTGAPYSISVRTGRLIIAAVCALLKLHSQTRGHAIYEVEVRGDRCYIVNGRVGKTCVPQLLNVALADPFRS